MYCIKCKSNNTEILFTEDIPCNHCNGVVIIDYIKCIDCSTCWKSIDGEPINDTVVDGSEIQSIEDISVLIETIINAVETEEPFDNLNGPEHPEIISSDPENKKFLCDYIHTCLMCNDVAHYMSDNTYKCVNCGFSWEVCSE